MRGTEKRKHKRLAVQFDLSCRKIGSDDCKAQRGQTVNVSPGGLFFETGCDQCKPGNLVRVELSIPAKAGLLELGGRISGLAKVLRTYGPGRRTSPLTSKNGVAVEFYQSPRLST